jgi:hypothetical protein
MPLERAQDTFLLRRGELPPHPEEEEDERDASQEERHVATIHGTRRLETVR